LLGPSFELRGVEIAAAQRNLAAAVLDIGGEQRELASMPAYSAVKTRTPRIKGERKTTMATGQHFPIDEPFGMRPRSRGPYVPGDI
jgi:hypothetical protein